jgi:hypothetical protein
MTRLICIPISAFLDILGLVPSNPRHNTSIKTFEVLQGSNKAATCCPFVAAHFRDFTRSGNRAATRCLFVAASLLLCCCLEQSSEPSRQPSGNRIVLSYILSSLATPFTLLADGNIERDPNGNGAATGCCLVAARLIFQANSF